MLRTRLTYANVMATIAVFGVLAGSGAYAASKIGPNEIRKNAVRSKHIDRDQVRAKQVHPRSVGRFLGIRSTGDVRLEAGSVFDEHVLASSGPIILVATCRVQGGPSSYGVLELRSSTGQGSYTGVRYERPPELMEEAGSMTQDGVVIADAHSLFGLVDVGVSFTASAGDSTLSGEARLSVPSDDACRVSFSGIAE